jgi:hypothetical protein
MERLERDRAGEVHEAVQALGPGQRAGRGGVERLRDDAEVGEFLRRAAGGMHGMPVGLELGDGGAADAGGAADDRDVLGHVRKVAGRRHRSNDPLLFRA